MGCLLWLAILVAVLAVLAVLFGGFQRGTKTGAMPPHRPPPMRVTALAT
jgi:uncharacterized protein YneF (UPF0154 family)